jgi:hypothetical protein
MFGTYICGVVLCGVKPGGKGLSARPHAFGGGGGVVAAAASATWWGWFASPVPGRLTERIPTERLEVACGCSSVTHPRG